MVKFGGRTGENKERGIIGVGLSRRNWEKLLDGEPIHFRGEGLGVKNVDVMIIGGEDERAIVRELRTEAEKAGVTVSPLEEMVEGDPEAQ